MWDALKKVSPKWAEGFGKQLFKKILYVYISFPTLFYWTKYRKSSNSSLFANGDQAVEELSGIDFAELERLADMDSD